MIHDPQSVTPNVTPTISSYVAGELLLDNGTCMVPEPGTFTCESNEVMLYDGTCSDVNSTIPQSTIIPTATSEQINIIKQWAGYSSVFATDIDVLRSLDIISNDDSDVSLPDWAKKYLGTLASTNKISAEQIKV